MHITQKCCCFPICNHSSKQYEHKQTNHTSPAYRTTWILHVSDILFSYPESHVPHNNANKSLSYLSKVAFLFSLTSWFDIILQSHWNLTGESAAQQQNRLPNFRAIGVFWYQYRGFDTSRDIRPIVSKPLPLHRAKRKYGSKTHSCWPAAVTRLRPAVVETHNMKIL